MLLIILLAVVLNEVLTPVIKGTVLSKLGVNMIALFIVFGLLYWVGMARLIRGQILTIKQSEYILAAKCIGTSSARNYQKTHFTELSVSNHHYYSASDTISHLY